METALADAVAGGNPDLEYVRGMAAGDESALRGLYAAYGRRLYAYALRLAGDAAVAEEALQDSLLAAWNGAGRFRGDAGVLTWLLGIVHHQALNAVRRKRLPAADLEAAAEVKDEASLPAERAEAADRRRALAACLRQLPREQQAALTLVFFEGLTLAEVAQVCGCPVGTVKSRLSAAKTHLRRALAAVGLEAEDLV